MRRVALALLALAGAAEAFVAPQPTAAPLTVVAGRNDKRTKKGKVYAGSNGKSRPRKPGGEKGPVDPCRGGVRLLFHRPIGATVARQIPVLKVTCSNHVSVTAALSLGGPGGGLQFHSRFATERFDSVWAATAGLV